MRVVATVSPAQPHIVECKPPVKPPVKHKKVAMIALYAVLFFALLALMVYALYRQNITGYVDISPANFNTVILGETDLDTLLGDAETPGYALAFGTTLTTSAYYPGMEGETFAFSVANGTTVANGSETGVTYTVRLRTLASLPLEYSLTLLTEDEPESGETEVTYTATTYVCVMADELVVDENGTTWHEYSFYLEEAFDADGVLEADAEEVSFDMLGGALALNKHQLLLEWPIVWADEIENETGTVALSTNDQSYMKEVETIQIVVTTTSTNVLDGSTVTSVDQTLPTVGEMTSNGVIIVSGAGAYTYEIEHRAFTSEAVAQDDLETEGASDPVDETTVVATPLGAASFGYIIEKETDGAATNYGLNLKVRYMEEAVSYAIVTTETTVKTTVGSAEETSVTSTAVTVCAIAAGEEAPVGGTETDTETVSAETGDPTTTITTTVSTTVGPARYSSVADWFEALID